MAVETAAAAATTAVQIDFSVMALFLRAHWVVQAVMVLLCAMSVVSWAIIFDKLIRYRAARAGTRKFEEQFWSGKSLDVLLDQIGKEPTGAIERVFLSGMREWRRSADGNTMLAGARDRIDRAMSVAVARESEAIESRLGFLATTGSTAPFIGLFGTVWGIKNAFEGIALNQDTSLAVVAPGIAEALVATALGLVAAIPAVVAYNKLIADAGRLTARFENFADEFSSILSRQLDKRGA